MAETGDPTPVEFVELNADAQEALTLQSLCMKCMKNGETRMILTKIPHFREVMVCSFECPHCGNRNNEIQFTGAYGETGVRYKLSVPQGDAKALNRQVVKSDAAIIRISELDFEIPAATQRSKITTVEGLLTEAAADLRILQDERRAAEPEIAAALDAFLEKLDATARADTPFTLVLDDPAGNSYVEAEGGNPAADPLLKVEHYERTPEQAAAIGLLPPEEPQGMPEISPDDVHHGAVPGGSCSSPPGAGPPGGRASRVLVLAVHCP
eukprot:jgi/Botrbrau1/5197/Bobra.0172s0065.1